RLAPRAARRSGPRALRTALVDLAQPGHAPRRPGRRCCTRRVPRLLARAQAPPRRARRARLLARLPAPPGRAVADAERVPSGRPCLPAAPLRLPLPGRRPPRALLRVRRPRGGDEGG